MFGGAGSEVTWATAFSPRVQSGKCGVSTVSKLGMMVIVVWGINFTFGYLET